MGALTTFRATAEGLEPTSIQADSLDEATLQIPNGAYSVLPIFEGMQVVRVERHLARMDHTLELRGMRADFDHARLRGIIREGVERAGVMPARVRLTLPEFEPGVAYLTVEAWQPYGEAFYRAGVSVVTTDALRRDVPRAKTTHFIEARSALLGSLPDGVSEAILCSPDGHLLEGASSNFYAVLDGVIHTDEGRVLVGVARSIVLDVCREEPPLPLVHEPVSRDDLPRLSEAMISSAGRGIVAVVEIDGIRPSGGTSGPVYAELRRRYEAVCTREQEAL